MNPKGWDPYFNLAAEEYLLKNFTEDIFMLWQSQSAIVVGKHQNALKEINHRYVHENNIQVARRLSGGGTVFHDPGNLNFTFIKNVAQIDQVNFKVFTQPIVAVLKELGLDAYTSGRNDLLLEDKKISGNAEHVYKKRVLHHGTLLYESHLDKLRKALKVDLSRFEDKAVQSNRSEVANISEFMATKMDVQQFADFIFEGIKSTYSGAQVFEFSSDDIQAIQQLRDEKYITWNWIYGYSPKYKYTNQFDYFNSTISFTMQVIKGVIDNIEWRGPLSQNHAVVLSNLLLGTRHDYQELSERIKSIETRLAPISAQALLAAII
ncbi:MAG TPA: lipoate--protein ligase [Sunxiuqinia sp.]|nr:lipoate--protein ligase [Sunxiuqinia sp.]